MKLSQIIPQKIDESAEISDIMSRKQTASSNIDTISYYDDNTLEVLFRSGDIYQYTNVPKRVWNQFKKAPSKGKFFHKKIRDLYDYKKILESESAKHRDLLLETFMFAPMVSQAIPLQPSFYLQFEYDILKKIKSGKEIDPADYTYNEQNKLQNLIDRKILTDQLKLTSKGLEYVDGMDTQRNSNYALPFANTSVSFQ